MSGAGLNRRQIEHRLHEKVDSDPDLKYYLDDECVVKLVDLLIDGIAEIIEENNQSFMDDILRGLSR